MSTWKTADTITDLGDLMAQWLQGRIPSWPGYQKNCGPDDETRHLIPTLARLNRAGFVTTQSQPGLDDTAYDGRPWRQRAAVQGYIAASSPLLPRIIRAAQSAGLTVTAYGPGHTTGPSRGLICTEWAGRPHTGFGGKPPRRAMASEWPGIGRGAWKQLRKEAVAVAVIDPTWGRDSRLWPALTATL